MEGFDDLGAETDSFRRERANVLAMERSGEMRRTASGSRILLIVNV